MKRAITWNRLMPTTADGEIIKVSIYYSSFNKDEIDKLQEELRGSIGTGIISEVTNEINN